MKHTEQRWMRTDDGHMTERAFIPTPAFARDYALVTVTWEEPEWEDVEETAWVIHFTDVDEAENFVHSLYLTKNKAEKYLKECTSPGEVLEIKIPYRRRKPESEAWESNIIIGALGNYVDLPSSATDHGGKKVRVEVVE